MKYFCEGAEEALNYGQVADKIAGLAITKLQKLAKGRPDMSLVLGRARKKDSSCSEIHSCSSRRPDTYRSVHLEESNSQMEDLRQALEAFKLVEKKVQFVRDLD